MWRFAIEVGDISIFQDYIDGKKVLTIGKEEIYSFIASVE
jgi:hypothetical protein